MFKYFSFGFWSLAAVFYANEVQPEVSVSFAMIMGVFGKWLCWRIFV